MAKMNWPDWWKWELEITPHAEKRMEQRDFTEIALREMLSRAEGYRPDEYYGRFVVEIRYHQVDWEVIVEPDFEEQLLVIVTAYPIRESKGR